MSHEQSIAKSLIARMLGMGQRKPPPPPAPPDLDDDDLRRGPLPQERADMSWLHEYRKNLPPPRKPTSVLAEGTARCRGKRRTYLPELRERMPKETHVWIDNMIKTGDFREILRVGGGNRSDAEVEANMLRATLAWQNDTSTDAVDKKDAEISALAEVAKLLADPNATDDQIAEARRIAEAAVAAAKKAAELAAIANPTTITKK